MRDDGNVYSEVSLVDRCERVCEDKGRGAAVNLHGQAAERFEAEPNQRDLGGCGWGGDGRVRYRLVLGMS